MRWALAALVVLLALPAGAEKVPARQGTVSWAEFSGPTDRYDHPILGNAPNWGSLVLTVNTCIGCAGLRLVDLTIALPETRVFEDTEPRLADLDGDGRREVVVVETDLSLGASLAVYGPAGKIAATGFIGQPRRWLAPAGIADFDGDGRVEVAYVDRPHLLGDLVLVRLEGDRLVETLRLPGFSNHRIGDSVISGGVRDCGQGPELVLASMDWSRVMRVRGGAVADIGPMPPTGLRVPPCEAGN